MTSVTVTSDSTATVNKSRISKTEIKLATVDEMLAEAQTLFDEHYEEIARNKHVMVLKPDEITYRKSEEMGSIFILSARQNDVLIGYSVNFVSNHLHYADLKLAQNDLLFISKEHRGGRVGLKFGSRKSNVQKIKETFGPKKKVPNKFKGFSKLPEKVQQKIDAKLAKKV